MHRNTPELRAIDPRQRVVREVAWHRATAQAVTEARITRRAWDVAGRPIAEWDPRLWATALPANTTTTHTLSGETLLQDSVDAGWRLKLAGADRQNIDTWDSRSSHTLTQYDDCLRPISVSENCSGEAPRVAERYTYGDMSVPCAQHNQRGRLIRHDDPAGSLMFEAYSLSGAVRVQTRHFLKDVIAADWPPEPMQRDGLLEEVSGHTTRNTFDATAAVISQTDAAGHQRIQRYGVSGAIAQTRVVLHGESTARVLLSGIRYNAQEQIESETLGNGITKEMTYAPQTGRLTRIQASRPDGSRLQDLNYRYDPIGNGLEVLDMAQPVRFFANQMIEPVSRYRYDSLYQLIEASGREVSPAAGRGPDLPPLQNLPLDPNRLSHYTQTYDYDAGGNLLEMRHVGARSFTRAMQVATHSNRSLAEETGADIRTSFDANGNLMQLSRGQSLQWDVRNQLRRVTAVPREDGSDDDEIYIYDSSGQRSRKLRSALTASRIVISQVRYLPGLDIRSEPNAERLEIIISQTGTGAVRILHWTHNKPSDVANNQVRYSLNDHLGSSTLEVDEHANLISHEGYHPFGGTAWWAASSTVQARYKTHRYSGKERDATGLYYYGLRYYAPWLNRWINPDPMGTADGMNPFVFVANNPTTYTDLEGGEGMTPDEAARVITRAFKKGLIADAIRRKNALEQAEDMVAFGGWFDRLHAAGGSLTRLMESNMHTARSLAFPLSQDEAAFYQRYISNDFHVTHTTDNADVLNQTRGLTLRSRRWLEERGQLTADHSNSDDRLLLNNFGYIFFALEAGSTLGEVDHYYGKTTFRIPFDEQFKHGHITLLDQSHIYLPDPTPLGLSETANAALKARKRAFEDYGVTLHMYEASQAKEAIALRIITTARSLPAEDRTLVLSKSTPEEMSLLTNTIFKPEVRFPTHFYTRNAIRHNQEPAH